MEAREVYSANGPLVPINFLRFLLWKGLDENSKYKNSINKTWRSHEGTSNNFHGCILSPSVGKKSEIWNFYSGFGDRTEPH